MSVADGLDMLLRVHSRKAKDLLGKFSIYQFSSGFYRDNSPKASLFGNIATDLELATVDAAIKQYNAVLMTANLAIDSLARKNPKACMNPQLATAKVLIENSAAFVEAKRQLRNAVILFRDMHPQDIWFHEIESIVSDLNRESDTVVEVLVAISQRQQKRCVEASELAARINSCAQRECEAATVSRRVLELTGLEAPPLPVLPATVAVPASLATDVAAAAEVKAADATAAASAAELEALEAEREAAAALERARDVEEQAEKEASAALERARVTEMTAQRDAAVALDKARRAEAEAAILKNKSRAAQVDAAAAETAAKISQQRTRSQQLEQLASRLSALRSSSAALAASQSIV